MDSLNAGCIRLFKVAGITVLLHWSWFLVALVEIQGRRGAYGSPAWNVLEYLALFGIVLMHEFGHALACRQVGGKAERIVLWPLGGVAFVNPPPRPGALLWSIAAGPLVNVLLVPVTIGALLLVHYACPPEFLKPASAFCWALVIINLILLIFNLLPIYPLDGGQILYAMLWFVLGRARGLQVCSVVGMMGAAAGFLLAVSHGSVWWIVLSLFVGWQALSGWKQARTLLWLEPAGDHIARGMGFVRQGAAAEAIAECDKALELVPEGQRARANVYLVRGLSHAQLRHYAAAEADLLQSLRIDPKNAAAMNQLAWLWATSPDPQYRHGEQAVQYATVACQATGGNEPSFLGTLAAALAEAGHFDMAIATQQKALADAEYQRQQGQQAYERIRLYQAGKPYHEATA
jgi:Zn-dependent protease